MKSGSSGGSAKSKSRKSEERRKGKSGKKRKDKKSKTPSKSVKKESAKADSSGSVKANGEKESEQKDTKPKDPCLIMTLGSSCLRIGRAEDKRPTTIPCCVAFRRKPLAKQESKKMHIDKKASKKKGKSPTPNGSTSRKRKREEIRGSLEKELKKRHRVMNGVEYTANNCTTKMSGDPKFWTNIDSKPSSVTGERALKIPEREPYSLFYPIRRGVLNVTDTSSKQSVRAALYYIIKDALEIDLQMTEHQWKSHVLLLAIPNRFNLRETSLLLDVLFNDLNFEKIFLQNEAVLACFGAGVSSACVVDSGAQKTHVCCVVDGSVVHRTEVHLDYGGDDIDQTLFWLLRANSNEHYFAAKDYDLNIPKIKKQVTLVKEKHCFFSELGTELPVQDSQILVRSPDEETLIHRFNIGTAALIAPRSMFDPGLLEDAKAYERLPANMMWSDPLADVFLHESGYFKYSRKARELGVDVTDSSTKKGKNSDKGGSTPVSTPTPLPSPTIRSFSNVVRLPKKSSRMPIHLAITESILSLQSLDLKAKLAKQVLLVGGSVMFKGIVDALEEELVAIIPYKVPGANTVNVILNPKNVDPKDLSWKGAFILSHGDTIRDQVVTKSEYTTNGIMVLRDKAAFSI